MFENNISYIFWREVVNTLVYIMNKVQITQGIGKTPYEIWFGHTPMVRYFRISGSKCYIKRDDDIGKFYFRSNEGFFLGYSLKSKTYRFFNQRLKTIVESVNMRVDEKFRIQDMILDYAYDFDGETNQRIKNQNNEK